MCWWFWANLDLKLQPLNTFGCMFFIPKIQLSTRLFFGQLLWYCVGCFGQIWILSSSPWALPASQGWASQVADNTKYLLLTFLTHTKTPPGYIAQLKTPVNKGSNGVCSPAVWSLWSRIFCSFPVWANPDMSLPCAHPCQVPHFNKLHHIQRQHLPKYFTRISNKLHHIHRQHF